MRFSYKLAVVLVIFIFPNFLPPDSELLLCPLVAWSTEEREFGHDGRDGADGQTGRRGRDGENRTIFTNGSPVNLELFGGDGEDGGDGRDGDDADCRRQPRDVAYDLRAPDGGNGGNGGDGGDGGNGGLLAIYYT
ncbi:collagen-like protein, partial [Coleofasciculus sp. LEGE 07081]|nr:collagen-like protein [Coleofasciculus sp. LEGE 07081]